MPIIVTPHSEQEEKVLRAFLDSLQYEYSEEAELDIPAPPGAKRQTLEEYNQEIAEAEAEYIKGKSVSMEELKKQMKSW